MNPKKNNNHRHGAGHGKFGKKADRIERAEERQPRSLADRKAAAGYRERQRNGW